MTRTIVNLYKAGDLHSFDYNPVVGRLPNSRQLLAQLIQAEFMAKKGTIPTGIAHCSHCNLTFDDANMYTLVIGNIEYRWTEMLRHCLDKHQGEDLLVYDQMIAMFKDITDMLTSSSHSKREPQMPPVPMTLVPITRDVDSKTALKALHNIMKQHTDSNLIFTNEAILSIINYWEDLTEDSKVKLHATLNSFAHVEAISARPVEV